MPLSPEQAALRGRIGAYSLHAKCDPRKTTENARRVFLSRFEREVDPEGILDPEVRAKRAEYARRAYFARLALKSVQARCRRARRTEADSDLGLDEIR